MWVRTCNGGLWGLKQGMGTSNETKKDGWSSRNCCRGIACSPSLRCMDFNSKGHWAGLIYFSSLVNECLKKGMQEFQVDSYEATWRNIDAPIFMSPSCLTGLKIHGGVGEARRMRKKQLEREAEGGQREAPAFQV